MLIELPRCSLQTCRYYFDGNCSDKNKYDKCEFAFLKYQFWQKEIEEILEEE